MGAYRKRAGIYETSKRNSGLITLTSVVVHPAEISIRSHPR